MASILFWIFWSRKCVSKKMVIEVLGGKPARWLVGWPVAAGRSVHPSHDDDPSDPALSRSHPPVPLSLSSPSSGLGSTIMVCATVARKWFFVRFIHTPTVRSPPSCLPISFDLPFAMSAPRKGLLGTTVPGLDSTLVLALACDCSSRTLALAASSMQQAVKPTIICEWSSQDSCEGVHTSGVSQYRWQRLRDSRCLLYAMSHSAGAVQLAASPL